MEALAQKLMSSSAPELENEFKHTQSFKDALVQVHTSISNVWSIRRRKHDLRVLIRLLLRVHLRPIHLRRMFDRKKASILDKFEDQNLEPVTVSEARSMRPNRQILQNYDIDTIANSISSGFLF